MWTDETKALQIKWPFAATFTPNGWLYDTSRTLSMSQINGHIYASCRYYYYSGCRYGEFCEYDFVPQVSMSHNRPRTNFVIRHVCQQAPRSQKTDLWWLREAEYFTSLITFSTEKQQHQSLSPLNITNQNCTQHTHIILMAIFQMDLVNQLILHF